VAVAIAALGYVAYAMWSGLRATGSALAEFEWPLYAAVLGLTLANYSLRFWKWSYLLRRVDAGLPVRINAPIFVTGLAMVITPAKAGELVKPWLVKEAAGTAMVRTIPVLVTERVTDGIAVIALAALGVGTYASDSASTLLLAIGTVALGLAALSSENLSMAILRFLARLSLIGRLGDRLVEMYRALRTCVAPGALFVTVVVSLVAWWAECVGYWLVFRGLHVTVSLDLATFLYASATVLGAPSPGGMGLADAGLVEGARALVPGLGAGQAMAAALLVRVATLWFGVVLGALMLLRVDAVIRRARAEG